MAVVTQAKLDVYPVENYVLRPLDGPLAAVLVGGGGNNKSSHNKNDNSGGSAGGGAAAAAAEMRRRVRTPLEKLVTLRSRVQTERQPVQSVEGVCVVHLHRHPHVLLLRHTLRRNRDAAGQRIVPSAQTNADIHYRLPGGRCRRGEAEEACLLRKLGRCLLGEAKQTTTTTTATAAVHNNNSNSNAAVALATVATAAASSSSSSPAAGLIVGDATSSTVVAGGAAGMSSSDGAAGDGGVMSEASVYFRVGDVLARWYRPHYSPLVYPYIPPHLSLASMKEVRSVFVVHLEPMAYLRMLHTDVELVAVPLFDLHDNAGKYGPVLAALPTLLSRLVINYCDADY